MKSPLNRTSAPNIVRFFDICFKQGVYDAYNYGDDYDVKKFISKHKRDWDFGVLGEPDDYDWEMWRFTLYRWARMNKMTKFAENYIYQITKKNYLWYFLPYCMRFYMLGMQEWVEYPNPVGMELFRQESKIHWKPMEKHLRKMTVNDFISYMQEFAYELRRVPEEARTMKSVTMDGFCQAVHDLTRKYETGKNIRKSWFQDDDF